LLLRRPLLLLRRTLWLRTAALRSLRTAIAASLALLLLRPGIGPWRTSTAAATRATLILLPRPLLELLQLPLHVLADRTVLTGPHLVETAVRAALPTFGIGFPAGVAKDAFGERHCRAGRIVHFQP
jgi:hypothetical protein